MAVRRMFVGASLLAIAGCATPLGETPPLCQATIEVAREAVSSVGSAQASFIERDGVVSCNAEGAAQRICAAYAAEPPGAGLAPIGAALRYCLYGHGYIRTAERREVAGESVIAAMRGGFRFGVTLQLRLDEAGTRYQLDLDERIIITELDGAASRGL